MNTVLYLNCFSGISGDMVLGALLDILGERELQPFLEGLALEGYGVTVRQAKKAGIAGLDVQVHAEEAHPHRGLRDVLDILEQSELSPFVQEKAGAAFRLMADAEGVVHGMPPEEVHFHEVGAVDSIVDIVGACALMEALQPAAVVASAVNVGSGTVHCAHGEFPVPAPATLKLLEGIPVYARGEAMERTTPTGAVLLRTFADRYGLLPRGVVAATGYGLGDRDSDLPNLLQGVLLEASGHTQGREEHHGHPQEHAGHQHGHPHEHPHSHDHHHGGEHDAPAE
ncbi:MAG: LarC family nickel insertion protein [Synergistales bacterium]|nr:LarC family nickel insertion protein [Synergistales bacterium]